MVINSALASTGCHYKSVLMRPTVSFGADFRWTPVFESERMIQVNSNLPGAQPQREGVGVTTVDRLAVKPCQSSGAMTDKSTAPFKPTAGNGPGDFFAWLAKTPLKFPRPTPTSVAGYRGLETTVSLPDGSLPSCGGVLAYTWTTDITAPSGWQWVRSGFTWRLIALDVGGTTVTIETWAPVDRFAAFEPEAEKLLAGLRFE